MNTGHTRLPAYGLRPAAVACAGVFAAIAVLSYVSFDLGVLLALGSFGSSAVLLFGFADSHFAQPRSILGGHCISSAIGLLALTLLGRHWWALAAAVSLATACMMLCRCVHPPAGSNPIIVFLTLPNWDFLLFPTFSGALVLVAVGYFYHRACKVDYPQYWLGQHGRASDTAAVALDTSVAASGTTPWR